MSINVTVTGNPINIQKGRMVTASPNHSKKEFERRRIIRLSQVRQQSKTIAEDVRNRVRRQKLKEVEEIEKEGQKKLKQWQARKLLELQNQYHEALRDIGAGHKGANSIQDEGDILSEKHEKNSKTAKQRAEIATKKLREEKEKLKNDVTVPIQKKKLVREIENKRAHMITSLKRSSEAFKRKNSENLSTETEVSGIVTDSDSDYEDIEEDIQAPETTNIEINVSKSHDQFSKTIRDHVKLNVNDGKEIKTGDKYEENITTKSTFSDHDELILKELREQKDTRISDRIRKRSSQQLDQPDFCDTLSQPQLCPAHGKNISLSNKNICSTSTEKNVIGSQSMFPNVQQNIYACSCNRRSPVFSGPAPCHCSQPTPRYKKPDISDINHLRCRELTDEDDNSKKIGGIQKTSAHKLCSPSPIHPKPSSGPKQPGVQIRSSSKEIPPKPKITLKSVKNTAKNQGTFSQKTVNLQNKTDHSKFLAAHVERIYEENLTTSPDPVTEADFHQKMRQRDKDAILRGQKAFEREKLQREYNELMKKLPALQKLERLYEMKQDKPEYHMTEERLREQERKKQSILDNTYEKLFPDRRPPTVTIPPKNISRANIEEKNKTLLSDDSATLNLGTWETGKKSKKLYTEEEVEALLQEGKIPSESKFRTGQLKSVLEKLRKQKEELLKEIQNLPSEYEKLSKVSPYSSKFNKENTSSDSSRDNDKFNKLDRSKKIEAPVVKSSKNFASKKVGTNSKYQDSSSDEPIKKHIKSTKQVKVSSKSVQVNQTTKKSTSVKTKSSKSISPQKNAKKRRPERDIISSSEQSSSEQTTQKKSSKESFRSSAAPIPNKRQKQIAIHSVDHPGTPSVPTNSLISVNEPSNQLKDGVSQPKGTVVSCDCKKDSLSKKTSDLCEIVIKIKDGKSSEVLIKEKNVIGKDKVKSVTMEKSSKSLKSVVNDPTQGKNDMRNPVKDDCCLRKNGNKPHSWHEKFSKNNSQVSNSSTSYMSPPQLPNIPEAQSKPPPYFCQLIGKKPQQLNLNEITSSPPTKLPAENPNVLDEIKRLLNMSRLSIDELGVSSVSTVTTPSQSIIDLESNKLNTTTTCNTSTTHMSINARTRQQLNISSNGTSQDGLPNFSFLTVSSDNRTIVASDIHSNSEDYPNILAKYAKIADQCSQRISNLSAMIEKVREEKKKMLEAPSLLTTNDSSTRYMDLPSPKRSINEKDSTGDYQSPSSSSSEGRSLLDINYSLAEKLKGSTPEEIEKLVNTSDLLLSTKNKNGDDDLYKRLRALREPLPSSDTQEFRKDKTELKDQSVPKGSGDSVDFVPFLLDIPKIPPLNTENSTSKHKKPPPSKGFFAARKLTEDFVVPHELSTIPEQDSQSRFESILKEKSPQTPNERKKSSVRELVPDPKKSPTLESKKMPSPMKSNEKKIDEDVIQLDDKKAESKSGYENVTPLVIKTKPLVSNNKNGISKVKDLLNHSDNSLVSSNTSGDEKVEMLRIEAMLRSIGMDWAISTLRKTQEALALTSSSSSIDLKSSGTIKELTESDIKEYLTKEMFQKISSSTLRSDASPGSLNESHELSQIHNPDFAMKQTSTPVNRSREVQAHEKSSDLPSAIESEKGSKDFFSLPEHSQ